MARYLKEHLSFTQAGIELLTEEAHDGSGKTMKLRGVCIEGGVRNANERVYPVNEIAKAVDTINEQIKTGHSVLGEVDHPDDLKINLDRVSHMIEKMWMEGPAGMGTLKILPTPMGELVKTMLQSGVKLGVSSRGSGSGGTGSGGGTSMTPLATGAIKAYTGSSGMLSSPAILAGGAVVTLLLLRR